MSRLRPLTLSACLLLTLVSPAIAADHDQAVDCAAVIKITTQSMPKEHPSAPQVRDLITNWTNFAKVHAYPKSLDIDAVITARSDEIQTKIMGFQDRAKSQAYITELGGNCEAPPYIAVTPYQCKRLADMVKETAETRIMLENYVGWNTTEERSKEEIQASDKKRAETIQAQRRLMADAESLIAYYKDATPDNSLIPRDDGKRENAVKICQKQMG